MADPTDPKVIEKVSEKSVKDAHEAVEELRTMFKTVSGESKSTAEESNSVSKKVEEFDGVQKEKFKKLDLALEEYDKKNQTLTLSITAKENEKKELDERIANLEKQVVIKSSSSTMDYKGTPEYKAFNVLVKLYGQQKGFDAKMLGQDEIKYLRTDIGDQGGYTVPEVLDPELLREIVEITPILSLVRTRNLPGVKTLNIPIRSNIPTSFWVGENQEVDESQSSYKLATLTAHALGVKTETTRDLINFSGLDIMSEIQRDAMEEFSREIGKVLLLGNNDGRPEGILDSSAGVLKLESEASGVLKFNDMIRLFGELKTGQTLSYGFNRRTLVALRLEQDSNNQYLWRVGGESMPSTIIDMRYVIMQDMPDIAIGATPVVLGDWFRGYTVLDAMQMELVRDDVTKADKRAIIFNWFRFLDGKVTLPEAFHLIEIKA